MSKAPAPLKIEPPEWLPLANAYQQIRDRLGSRDLAERELHARLCDGQLGSAMRHISYKRRGVQQVISMIESGGQETHALLDPDYWQGVLFSVDGNEHLRIRHCDGSAPLPGRLYIFVRAADFERLYPTAPAAAAVRPADEPPLRRRGPVLKHDWHAINGEIARRCHDKSGRICVPKSESKLAAVILQWCVDTGRPQPADSEMRDAVKAICAALRQKI